MTSFLIKAPGCLAWIILIIFKSCSPTKKYKSFIYQNFCFCWLEKQQIIKASSKLFTLNSGLCKYLTRGDHSLSASWQQANLIISTTFHFPQPLATITATSCWVTEWTGCPCSQQTSPLRYYKQKLPVTLGRRMDRNIKYVMLWLTGFQYPKTCSILFSIEKLCYLFLVHAYELSNNPTAVANTVLAGKSANEYIAQWKSPRVFVYIVQLDLNLDIMVSL